MITVPEYNDFHVVNGMTYTYYVTVVYSEGESAPSNTVEATPPTDVTDDQNRNTVTQLGENYPNPFNPSTMIHFDLKEKSQVTLSVYNTRGECVKHLTNASFSYGKHQLYWNGTNDKGNSVSSGIYYYKMKAGNYTKIRKMLLIK